MISAAGNGFTAFSRDRIVARGALRDVAPAAHLHREAGVLVFEDASGRPVDLDLRGSLEEALARLSPPSSPIAKPARGRPKLGVTAREVTLLPRHWEWLANQPGGASATLRRLVDHARRESAGADEGRRAQEATYRVMTALAGNLPHYEEATRALFAGDLARLNGLTAGWPADISGYILDLSAVMNAPSP